MSHHFKFGSYSDSYLLIQLNIIDSLENLENLADVDAALFFHEYTHFLQNITSGCGRSNIWYTYDRTRQLLADKQNSFHDELLIPVNDELADEQRLHNRIFKAISGNAFLTKLDDSSTFISDIKLVSNDSLDFFLPANKIKFVILELSDGNGNSGEYQFGDIAITETMAWLIEEKHFPGDFNNYPSKASFKVAEFIGATFVWEPEFLFALCDISLFSNYPGWMFYELARNIAASAFVPKIAEDIYDYGFQFFVKLGFDIWRDFKEAQDGIFKVLDELLSHPLFKETRRWFKYIIAAGQSTREQIPHFMLMLYREPKLFKGYWQNVMAQFGSPQLHNLKNERFFRAPLELKEIEEKIEPFVLLAIQQISDTLIYGKTECSLTGCCSQSTNSWIVDDRCFHKPWEKSKDDVSCAFSALWTGYGLSEKSVITEG